jgi:hypothetical protein
MNQLETPVALFVFNRPETTRQVFSAVAAARPARLFLIADGPRADRPGELKQCELVRKIITAVDWPCQVETSFASENMGCRRRVISGLNYVFSAVEHTIILEDDCVPDPSFFPFCAELLERHRNDPQIAYISGFNPLEKNFPFRFSYYYSQMANLWGWATWRRAWKEYDENIRTWPAVKEAGLLSLIFPDKKAVAYWSSIFDRMHQGTGPNTWDYQWVYVCWTRYWLSVVPRRNLIHNIGFGGDATHPQAPDLGLTLPAGAVDFPLKHPPAITAWPHQAIEVQRRFYTPNIPTRLRRKVLSKLGSVS